MTFSIYGIEYRNTETGSAELCEVEQGVVHMIGELGAMRRAAARFNRTARGKGWAAQYRPVPLPFTTQLPEWFEYA